MIPQSIDDILNASDSDDDDNRLIGKPINLEDLLDDDDDPNTVKTAKVSDISRFEAMDTTESVYSMDKYIQTTRPSTYHIDTFIEESAMETSGNLSNVDDVTISSYLDIEGNSCLELNALEKADQREQRFLSSGNRDVVSILQTKKEHDSMDEGNITKATGIKFEEMTALSSQLKRNSNYKQHGPGQVSLQTLMLTIDIILNNTYKIILYSMLHSM